MAIAFQVRVGIPGSLTIEVDAIALPVGQSRADLQPQISRPVLYADDKIISPAWGQGWAVPVSQRLIALGGDTRLQLLRFECPSIDTTDMLWGATGTVDATTDPVTVQATPFGASVYGRQFAEGDYILWNDPASAGGRYQYEIDRIATLRQNTFTLERRPKNAGAGFAQFGSVKAAHAGIQFFQLLDKSFFDLWDGTHQQFQFLWDRMLVSACSITTPGLLTPSVQTLFPIPPAAAAMGLDTT